MSGPRKRRAAAALAGFALLIAGLASPAGASDRMVEGHRLRLESLGGEPTLLFAARSAAIGWPLPDPRDGAALRVGASAAPGRCRIDLALEPVGWHPLRFFGWLFGYWYWEAGSDSIVTAVLRHGRLRVFGWGPRVACDLSGAPLAEPLVAELSVGDERYCAAFGGKIQANDAQGFRARRAPAPAACSDGDLTVANLNVLHGITCSRPADQCRVEDRIELLFDWIEDAGCPDVVTLQEVVSRPGVISIPALIEQQIALRCPFEYEVVFIPKERIDDEYILTRHPVIGSELRTLHSGLAPGFTRHALWARIDHPVGIVDVFTTHLASGGDRATAPCHAPPGRICPFGCLVAGASTIRECQALQVVVFADEKQDGSATAVVTGDLNAIPGSFEYEAFTVRRDYIDSYLAAGNSECDAATGAGCTSGRDDSLDELQSPQLNVDRRIDYVFLTPPAEDSLCRAELDSADDDDGDGTGTRVFDFEPNPFAPPCGPEPDAVCWVSDHNGVEMDLNCAP